MASHLPEFQSTYPGNDVQAVATANFFGQDIRRIHSPVWAVVGVKGDSVCYLGVEQKVNTLQAAMLKRITDRDLAVRAIDTFYAGGVSDGQLNGTERMRFSMVGREITNEALLMHLSGSDVAGVIAVGACDKPPVGAIAALAEHNAVSIYYSDGSIEPGTHPVSGKNIDIVTGFQAGAADLAERTIIAANACPKFGSCGGMFTYNTMQSAIAAMGMEPIHMVSPISSDPRRVDQFPEELVDYLEILSERNIRARDIITPVSLRNAMTVAMALGGSTNIVLHAPEIARAAGIEFWKEVMSQEEFNDLSKSVPVLGDLRPFGDIDKAYSMVDIDRVGGLQVVIAELLDKGKLDGNTMTCTGETLEKQVERLAPGKPDGKVLYSIDKPFKETGGLKLLSGNLAPEGGAVIKVAGVAGVKDGVFTGKAKTFNGEKALLDKLLFDRDSFQDGDFIVIRYEGLKGGPGMKEMLTGTSLLTALCKEKGIAVAFMTDARFSGGSVGLVIGHVEPEAFDGGPIALVKDGDTIVADLNTNSLNCVELDDQNTLGSRKAEWEKEKDENGGVHPAVPKINNRLLLRYRRDAAPALLGGGISGANGVPFIRR